ncbi:CHAT domain-containing protein [Streptomyces sp. NPDC086549]|uniref:CHAT domain-containing protein n=1 Tax=Streptomyces sp. NPDC086549 TaxID=3365752 RepID=UPI00381CB778
METQTRPVRRLCTAPACLYGSRLPDEAVGLPSTLLETGVAGVVSALWRVPAVATAEVVIRMHRLLHQETGRMTPDEPLRRAQQGTRAATLAEKRATFPESAELRDLAAPDDATVHAHPTYWAGLHYTG